MLRGRFSSYNKAWVFFGGILSGQVNEILIELSGLSEDKLAAFLREQETLFKELVISKFESKPEELNSRLKEVKRSFEKLSESLNSLQLSQSDRFSKDLATEARAALKSKDFEKAFNLYQSLIAKKLEQKEGVDLELYILAGTSALHAKELACAEDFSERALLHDSSNVKAVMLKGLVHYLKKEFELALQVFGRALELNPESVQVRKYLKICQENIDNAAAAAGFKSVTAINRFLDPQESREFERRDVNLSMTLSDYESLTTMVVKVVNLSAGGCLINDERASQVPNEFNFSLEIGDKKVVHGYAKKRYVREDGVSVGIFFEELDDDSRDLINRRILSGVYG